MPDGCPIHPEFWSFSLNMNVAILEHATENHASTHDLGSSPAWNAGRSARPKPPRQGDPSITSSARASSVGGTSRPIAFATIRLTTRSNLVGCSTGRSAGFVPPPNLVDQVAGALLKSMKATVPTGVENSYFS